MPSPDDRAETLLGRLLRLVGRRDGARDGAPTTEPARRWPNLVRGWLDPDMPLTACRTTVDATDVEDVLRVLSATSEGRVGDAEIAEVLDALAHTPEGAARAFRFGKPRTFGQIWIGLVPAAPLGVKLFVLAGHALVESLEESLSIARFAPAHKRAEYEDLRRFFLAAWRWQWTAAPFAADLRASKPSDFDPSRAGESMERVLSNPGTPLLEVLRGLRRRTRDLLEETSDLGDGELAAADAYLAREGAPTLSDMRRRYRAPPATAPA